MLFKDTWAVKLMSLPLCICRFVKITLPEGVTEDGSQLSNLQTKFEEIIIAHGLLQPDADDASKGVGSGAHHVVEKMKSAISS